MPVADSDWTSASASGYTALRFAALPFPRCGRGRDVLLPDLVRCRHPLQAADAGQELATAAPVVSGQQYGLVLTSGTSTGSYRVNVQPSNTYTAGDADYYSGGTWHFDGDDLTFATYVTATPPATPVPATRGAYCTVAGNTTDSGFPLLSGAFVNLDEGQVDADPSYKGATPANFIKGVGLTCAAPPAGYTRHDYATPDMNVDGGMYPYYSN